MNTAHEVRHSTTYDVAITTGLVAYGVVHLLIAWIALQLAFGKSSQEASQQGALQELSSKPLGGVLLWIVAIGLFALVVWRVLQFGWGNLDTHKKVTSVGHAIAYLVLAVSAVKIAIGSGSSGSGGQRTVSARLMGHAGGRGLVVAIGVAIVAIGGYHVYKGITKKFTEDLVGGVSDTTVLLGRIGYGAKGIAYVVVGVLFGWAAIDYDPQKAGGLDTALRTIKAQPSGPVLLTALAVGIAAFGGYCFIWSRNARR